MGFYGLTIEVSDQNTAYHLGILITQAIHKELSGPRSGRWYPAPGNMFYDNVVQKNASKHGKTPNFWVKYIGTHNRNEILGAAYRASAPGEAPASRTGRLRQSFFMNISMLGQNQWKLDVRTNVFYAEQMNVGGGKVSARPYISKVLNDLSPTIHKMKIVSFLKTLKM